MVRSQQSSSSSSSGDPRPRISLRWRWLLSAALVLHLTAVFLPPFRFATANRSGAPSPAVEAVIGYFEPYIDFAFLDHGYFFFAPNPGPSHLVRCELYDEQGRLESEFMFPDLKRHWPRLLYHRHFMLSESLNTRYVPPATPVTAADAGELQQWQRRRELYEKQLECYRRHVQQTSGASRVELFRVQHVLPTPAEFLERRLRLNAAESYRDLSDDRNGFDTDELPTSRREVPGE